MKLPRVTSTPKQPLKRCRSFGHTFIGQGYRLVLILWIVDQAFDVQPVECSPLEALPCLVYDFLTSSLIRLSFIIHLYVELNHAPTLCGAE